MKIQYVSDTHFEFYNNKLKDCISQADLIILAGDIDSASRISNTLETFVQHYPHVIYVPGNHEYYGKSILEMEDRFQKLNDKFPTLHILNPGHIVLNDILFTGATFWPNILPEKELHIQRSINDFYQIKQFTPQKSRDLHVRDIRSLKQTLENSTLLTKIAITHFSPSPSLHYDFHYKVHRYGSDLVPYFHNFQTNLLPKATHWIYGHTHDSITTTIAETKVLSNQLGYHQHKDPIKVFNAP